jgi:hypothetical protein
MNRSTPSKNNWFWPLAGVSLVVAAIGMAALMPIATTYAHNRAQIIADSASKNMIDPYTGFQIAIKLDPGNRTYPVELAKLYLLRWQPNDADQILGDESTDEALILHSQIRLEQDRGGESAISDPQTEGTALQLALVLATTDRADQIEYLRFHVKTAEGERALKRIEAGGTPLAQELVVRNLPQTAIRVLQASTERSVARFVTLGSILLSDPQNSHKRLDMASDASLSALALDPSSIDAHNLRRQVLLFQGDKEGANKEYQIMQDLKAGVF